jgi:cytoskeletal protein RodZ
LALVLLDHTLKENIHHFSEQPRYAKKNGSSIISGLEILKGVVLGLGVLGWESSC